MESDDVLVGKVLSRREALAVLGALGAAALAACVPNAAATPAPATAAANAAVTSAAASSTATVAVPVVAAATGAVATGATPAAAVAAAPACVVRPAMTEGPYFVDEKLNRSDIRSDPTDGTVKDGAPLALTVNVSQIGSACTALSGATVDVWHCDAAGVYSDATDPSFNTKGKKFLRGYQTTDANGQVKFMTIYPGWYHGRTVHIHFKIRTTSGHEFTSQWFFDDGLTDKVLAQAPYAGRGQRDTRNSQDGIYQGGGDQLVLAAVPAGAGYAASFDIGLQFT